MNANKTVGKYVRLYRGSLVEQRFPDVQQKTERYEKRLREMLASPEFAEHNVYPTMDVELIYVVIAMCLELRDFGLANEEIVAFAETMFQKRRKFVDILIGLVDRLPNSFSIVRKWNIGDHEKRVKDGSIAYDYFRVTEDSVVYKISKCMYVEIFEHYGIRELCKIFCDTDVRAYAGLTKHMKFVRHSDLSDGDSCHDEVLRRQVLSPTRHR